MISAGRVLFIPKGEWNDTDTYSMLDLVSYNGSSYVAKTSVPANTLPTNTSYWQLSAYGGSAANLAGNFAPLEITDYASQGYAVGDFLVNKDNKFCKVTSIITIGDELILKPNTNYNIEADNVGEEVQQLTQDTTGLIDNTTQLSCVNLLNHEATAQTDSAGEVTWVINSDGTITAAVNKTTTQDRIIHLLSTANLNALLSKYGKIKITGSPNSRAYIYTKMSNNQYYSDEGAGLVLSGTALQDLRLAIASGTTAQTFTIKPMISLASMNLSYDDYVPYAKSNRELTEINTTKDLTAQITNVNQKMTNSNYFLVRYGNVCSLRLYVGNSSDVTAWTEALLTIPSNCKPKTDIYIAEAVGSGKCILIRSASGDVNVMSGSETLHAAQFFCTWVVL